MELSGRQLANGSIRYSEQGIATDHSKLFRVVEWRNTANHPQESSFDTIKLAFSERKEIQEAIKLDPQNLVGVLCVLVSAVPRTVRATPMVWATVVRLLLFVTIVV